MGPVGQYGRTSLHLAAEKGQIDVVSNLVAGGADIHAKDEYGTTPLKNHKKVIEFLVEKDADVNIADNKCENTALHRATEKGFKAVVEFLVEKGAKVNAINIVRETPLQLAVRGGHKEIVGFLVANGADVNTVSKFGGTALHSAVEEGYTDIARFLVEKGAYVNARGEDRRTPLHCAAAKGSKEIVEFLIGKGADVHAVDNMHGETPLHKASKCGHRDVIKVLLDKGADPALKDRYGRTAIELAKNCDIRQIFEDAKGANVSEAPNPKLNETQKCKHISDTSKGAV
ncbi:Ankyrin repeat-containing domain,Ankyrin repeat [Cinara cedri]|uniref:Ankyrin repeat-containing domain,Ankyrin repeat n=1 Tax=Cinara cedri TaxID=506608 RepID=A0A5E4MW38_9HEMI|nr:Ankyrin repeat-containing domain,Ankyrin repeat [Cinara cedri]